MPLILLDLPDECLDYFELSNRKRSHEWKTQLGQDWCDSEHNLKRKSPEWNGTNWYRFVGEAGAKIPENQGKSYLISQVSIFKSF